jgi:hypothetical protein
MKTIDHGAATRFELSVGRVLIAVFVAQCGSIRRRIAEPFLRSTARVGGLSLITVGESFFNVSKARARIERGQSFCHAIHAAAWRKFKAQIFFLPTVSPRIIQNGLT